MRTLLLSTSIAMVLTHQVACAQDAPAPIPALRLDETVVTSSPLGHPLFEQAQPVSIQSIAVVREPAPLRYGPNASVLVCGMKIAF